MRMANRRLARSTSEAAAGETCLGLSSFGVGARRNFFVALVVWEKRASVRFPHYLKTIVRVLGEQDDCDEFLSIPRIESEKRLDQLECASGL
jgi:hypothetical protein